MTRYFKRWWSNYGANLAGIFTYAYVAERAYRAGYNRGKKHWRNL